MPTFSFTIDHQILTAAMDRGEPIDIRLRINLPGEELPQGPRPMVRGPLAGLIEAGLLSIGDTLQLHQSRANRTGVATVEPDGSLSVEGKAGTFPSPSKAAGAVTGGQVNGWILWRRESDGKTLDDLRAELD